MKKSHVAAAAVALVSTLAVATPAFAWDLLGTFTVRDRVDVDTLTLPGNRVFSRIKVCAYRHPVHIIDIDIHFANGGHQDVDTRWQINPGECTRNIDLNGANRNISAIVLKYEENSWKNRRATARVFGE